MKENTLDLCTAVATFVDLPLQKLTCKQSPELGMPWSTMQCHINTWIWIRSPSFTNKLSHSDMNQHHAACCAVISTFPNTISCSAFVFTDECTIYSNTHDRNVQFWAQENPHFTTELEHNPPRVILQCNRTGTHLIGTVSSMDLLTPHATQKHQRCS
jgi:hypothetical protein